MQVIALMVFTFTGMGLVAALMAALYASLPRSFLDSAERHGRFGGLEPARLVSDGAPSPLPADALGGQAA
jgi:hypothetical protein